MHIEHLIKNALKTYKFFITERDPVTSCWPWFIMKAQHQGNYLTTKYIERSHRLVYK